MFFFAGKIKNNKLFLNELVDERAHFKDVSSLVYYRLLKKKYDGPIQVATAIYFND